MAPFHLVYDSTVGCYFITEVGVIHYAEALQVIDLLLQDHNYLSATRILWDVRLSRPRLSRVERTDVLSRIIVRPLTRMAFVTNPGTQFGTYQPVKDASEAGSVEITTDMAAARQWLGLPLAS